MFKKLYVLRHGLAVNPGEEYGQRVLSATLLPEAIPVIERLGASLQNVKCDAAFVSPVLRCQQTAAIVTEQTGQQFTTDDRLREYHAENFAELVARAKSFVQSLTELPPEVETVWVCTHGAMMGGVKNLLMENKFEPDDELDYPFPGSLYLFARPTETASFSLTTIDFNFEPPHSTTEVADFRKGI